MKYVVKGLLLGVLIGAAAGGILLGSFGALLTFTKNDGEQALAAVLFGFAVAGFYGAIPGGVLGGIGGVVVGLIRRAMANSAAERQAMAVSPQLFSSAPMASAAPAVPQGHWIGAVGETLELAPTCRASSSSGMCTRRRISAGSIALSLPRTMRCIGSPTTTAGSRQVTASCCAAR